ncbi:MAG: type I-E CRISPR-associated protein Cse1/CasA [Burkholderiaceae bacterium]|nr:type I-E CRISPR-associated protein Cse1/CasA [Burkholderiaceae bacterium]
MNLLTEPWMPVRRRDGGREWVAPPQLARPDILAFDADRADFNGALAQFAIGLLQTTTPIERHPEWRALLAAPPDEQTLAQWFEPVRAAFEFDGDGARFMQDFRLAADEGTTVDIGTLLIDAPGEQTLKNNADHFVKRDGVTRTCPRCAATALFTLQLNAPAGGAGHRTGLRGGGPLTTLLLASDGSSLWAHLWVNVIERDRFLADTATKHTAPEATFPWLAPISAIQKDGGETSPARVHPAHVFWAMPRRIRLNASQAPSGPCDICGGASSSVIRAYRTRNHGLNYKGAWNHPLSPYYETKEGWLPIHPQPGGLGYRHWLPLLVDHSNERKKQRRARVVEHFLTYRTRTVPGALRLWAFGFDMDNMKARCWYEATLPLYGLGDCDASTQRRIEAEVTRWLKGAELAGGLLRGAVKDAWFKEAPSKADYSAIDAAFWSRTEPRFYAQIERLIENMRCGRDFDGNVVNLGWLRHLQAVATRLFDHEFVGTGPVEQEQPRRIAEAYQQLQRGLHGPKLREMLGLRSDQEPGAQPKPKRSAKPMKEAP